MNKGIKGVLVVSGAAAAGWLASGGSPLVTAVSAAMAGLVMASGPGKKAADFGTVARGTQVSTKKRRGFKSGDQIQVGGIPIDPAVEVQHIIGVGAPGTGKTVANEAVLDVVRTRGQRAIVYDSTGEFVSHFYRPDKDIILSPIDTRSAQWSPWAEGTDPYSLLNLATAFIPESNPDKFWGEAGRAILQSVLEQTKDMAGFSDVLFKMELGELYDSIVASGYGGYIGPPNQFASARSVACVYCRPLTYLPPLTAKPFSIREWIRDEHKDSWLFVSSRADVHESIRPLISMWLGIAVQSCMSLSPDRNRRLWFVLDELPTLQKLPSLDLLLGGARKYGAAAILGVQSIAQIRDVYGREAAAALLSHPSTRLTLRVGDSETAEYLSKNLGDRHTIRKVSSEGKDGSKSESEQHSIEAAVLPSEILALPNLTGYLRVPNDPVIKKIKLTPRDRAQIAAPYQDRSLSKPPPVPSSPPSGPSGVLDKSFLASLTTDSPDLPGL
ncbi:MAG: type IV secretion system DNA-binding domain-containing protein [Acidiferrobacter thiooxydans]